ncbi:hypothetical protein Scani_46530 [Streptomyces caniferus]|uniref:Uncharacterized protein n=1 Tax=Streptomyces caniferus TaxID=285557 RepID=A0A640SFN7_9ACTN|nr:hypothetical protein Scani_46530 [Streptomyces caniferus]
MALAALFQAGVVVRVHAGQDGDLLTAQSADSADAVARHADVLRLHARPACAQEISQVVVSHALRLGRGAGEVPGCAAPRHHPSWSGPARPRSLGVRVGRARLSGALPRPLRAAEGARHDERKEAER